MTVVTTSIGDRIPVEARPAGALPEDPARWIVLAGATVASGAALVLAYRSGAILGHPDAIGHLQIARRVVAGHAPGLAQLGGQRLPLHHLLMTPLVGFDDLYATGLAGALVSAASYIVCCGLLYQIIRRMLRAHAATGFATPVAAIAGTMVFALNPHVLEWQSMPLPGLPLYATLLGTVYYLGMWLEEPVRQAPLVLSAVCALLGTLTSYAAWFVVVILTGLAMWRSWRFSAGKPRRAVVPTAGHDHRIRLRRVRRDCRMAGLEGRAVRSDAKRALHRRRRRGHRAARAGLGATRVRP